jgi:hypothetical protein
LRGLHKIVQTKVTTDEFSIQLQLDRQLLAFFLISIPSPRAP